MPGQLSQHSPALLVQVEVLQKRSPVQATFEEAAQGTLKL
jgi:hypothetical protein